MSSKDTNPYKFTVKGTTFDFYDLSDAIGFEQSAVEHAVKKLVALGKRSGNKSYGQDLHEAIMSLIRAQEQYNESLRQAERTTREGTSGPLQGLKQPYEPVCSESRSRGDVQGDGIPSQAIGYTDDGVEEAVRHLIAWSSLLK